jgi:hypothetical protein
VKRALALFALTLALVVDAAPAGAASDKTRIKRLERQNAALTQKLNQEIRDLNAVVTSLGELHDAVIYFRTCFLGGLAVTQQLSPDASFAYLMASTQPSPMWYVAVMDPLCLNVSPSPAGRPAPMRLR